MDPNKPPPPEERFFGNIESFCSMMQVVLEGHYRANRTTINPAMALLAKTFLCQKEKSVLVEGFIAKSKNYWGEILGKEESFFLGHISDVFSDIPSDHIESFTEIFRPKEDGTSVVTSAEKEEIWQYFQALVKISIHYIHKRRGPRKAKKEGVEVNAYANEYEKDIPLMAWSSKFGVKLEW